MNWPARPTRASTNQPTNARSSYLDLRSKTKWAVSWGLVVDAPLVFLRIGCVATTGALDVVEEDVVLSLPWLGR
jgi:hypothetical protein